MSLVGDDSAAAFAMPSAGGKLFSAQTNYLGAKTLYHSGKAFGQGYSRVITSAARKTQE